MIVLIDLFRKRQCIDHSHALITLVACKTWYLIKHFFLIIRFNSYRIMTLYTYMYDQSLPGEI